MLSTAKFVTGLAIVSSALLLATSAAPVLNSVRRNASPGRLIAVYNSTLKAPWCELVGTSCDSGYLLQGRDTIQGGVEANQPNTIFNSCKDGTGSPYLITGANDRILVASIDGGTLTHGKEVRVTTADRGNEIAFLDDLDLYYTENAMNPNWVKFATIQVYPSEANYSATYTLPTGRLQAVRASLHPSSEPGSVCTQGQFDDHDDLIFAVN
jgi:leucyl aminopeptidase